MMTLEPRIQVNNLDEQTTLPIPVNLRLTTLEELYALWAFLYLPGEALYEALSEYYDGRDVEEGDQEMIHHLQCIDNYDLWERVDDLVTMAETAVKKTEEEDHF